MKKHILIFFLTMTKTFLAGTELTKMYVDDKKEKIKLIRKKVMSQEIAERIVNLAIDMEKIDEANEVKKPIEITPLTAFNIKDFLVRGRDKTLYDQQCRRHNLS